MENEISSHDSNFWSPTDPHPVVETRDSVYGARVDTNRGRWGSVLRKKVGMEKNEKVRVKSDAPRHANRVGYYQFNGKGLSDGVVVLATEPDGREWFTVSDHDIISE